MVVIREAEIVINPVDNVTPALSRLANMISGRFSGVRMDIELADTIFSDLQRVTDLTAGLGEKNLPPSQRHQSPSRIRTAKRRSLPKHGVRWILTKRSTGLHSMPSEPHSIRVVCSPDRSTRKRRSFPRP